MLINFIGTRGTHPSPGQGTMSFIVDNKIVFDICPEFVFSYTKFIDSWNNSLSDTIKHVKNLYGTPSFSKIEHIFISHLHYDHWGGLRHLLIWSQMFEGSFREERPIHVYIPKKNLELFQFRLQELFQVPKENHLEESDFFLRYLMVEIDISLAKYVRIHAIENDQTISIGKYEIKTFENKHFRGSLSYKLESVKYTLNEDQLEIYGIPKGPLLSKLQKESKIEFNGELVKVEDIFTINKTILGYSGDTQLDDELLKWFSNCTHLVHETTYLENDEMYHTDSHTSLSQLLPIIKSFENLLVFLPVHFSGRYSWNDVEEKLVKINEDMKKLSIFAPKLGTVIYYEEKEKKTQIEDLILNQKY